MQYPDGKPCRCHAEVLLELLYGEKAGEPKTAGPHGCLYPGECLASGEHQTSECFSAKTLEATWLESERERFDDWWEAEGCRMQLNRDAAWEVWLAARSQYPYYQ